MNQFKTRDAKVSQELVIRDPKNRLKRGNQESKMRTKVMKAKRKMEINKAKGRNKSGIRMKEMNQMGANE